MRRQVITEAVVRNASQQDFSREAVEEIANIFIHTEFEGGQHVKRVNKIQQIDEEERK